MPSPMPWLAPITSATRPAMPRSIWAVPGSNRRPLRCKRSALPTELTARRDCASRTTIRPVTDRATGTEGRHGSRAQGADRDRAPRPSVRRLPRRERRPGDRGPRRRRHGDLDRAQPIGRRPPRVGRRGFVPPRAGRDRPRRVHPRRRRALAERLVRERRARQRPPAAARRRHDPHRPDARPVPQPRERRGGVNGAVRRRAHRGRSLARAKARAGRALPPLQGGRGVRDPGDQPGDRRRADPLGRRREDPPARTVREVRRRGAAAEPEARRARRARAAERPRSANASSNPSSRQHQGWRRATPESARGSSLGRLVGASPLAEAGSIGSIDQPKGEPR